MILFSINNSFSIKCNNKKHTRTKSFGLVDVCMSIVLIRNSSNMKAESEQNKTVTRFDQLDVFGLIGSLRLNPPRSSYE